LPIGDGQSYIALVTLAVGQSTKMISTQQQRSTMHSHKKKLVVVVLTMGLTLGIAGAAFAYFTSTGSGTGGATVSSATNWTVVAAPATGTMYPGSGTSTVPFTVTNPNTGGLAYNTLSAVVATDGSGNITQGGTPVTGCLSTWFVPVLGTPSVAAGVSIAGGGNFTVSVSVTMTDSLTDQDPCQGAAPDITLNVG
jgi:hypothetical protein